MTYQEYEQEVQRHLTDRRFTTAQCVAREAARLAQRYGADVKKPALRHPSRHHEGHAP